MTKRDILARVEALEEATTHINVHGHEKTVNLQDQVKALKNRIEKLETIIEYKLGFYIPR